MAIICAVRYIAFIVKDQISVQNVLQQKLSELQGKNPLYSLRAFAVKLGIGAGPLSQILSGQRFVSRRMAAKFCDALLLDPTERQEVLRHFAQTRTIAKPSRKLDEVDTAEVVKLNADQFKVVSDWYYYAILSLTKLQDFEPDTEWIANRLGIQKEEARLAIERLFRLGLLEVKQGKWLQVKPRYKTSDDIANLSIRKAHHQTLELAKQSLDHDDINQRDFTTLTLPVNTDAIPRAKEIIRKFQQDLCEAMMAAKKFNEVYKLSVEFFPLTKIKRRKL